MKPIVEYKDYRQYISDFYAERKAASGYTWRAFAKDAGFSSPVYLKHVGEGKFNLSAVAVERVAQTMNLVGFELQYFRLMVEFDHAKTAEKKKAVFEEMLSLADSHKIKVLDGDSFRFFESWKNPVIRELAPSMPGAKPLELAHACRPQITAAEVSETLSFLVKSGILEKRPDGSYVQTGKVVTTGPMEVTPLAVCDLHRQMGSIALDAIQGVPQDKRHFSGVTVGITSGAYQQIVKEIAEFRRKVLSIATKDVETEQVYRLNMQFFPMTCKPSSEAKQDGGVMPSGRIESASESKKV